MWPILLDMSKEESMQRLRCLEIDAFSGLVNALRAQGNLNSDKLKLLKDTGTILHISQERHKAEIRRVVNDERLNTIAYHVNGECHSTDEWADEGQRLIPLMPRVAPQTAYSAIADEVADTASKLNKQLPLPASTERKRPMSVSPTQSNASTSELSNKNQMPFRAVEPELKKRKLSINMDNCGTLAQHLMAPPKISKIQQIYRQKSKTRLKEQLTKLKTQEMDKSEYVQLGTSKEQLLQQSATKFQPKLVISQPTTSVHSPKINILQNISTTLAVAGVFDEPNPHMHALIHSVPTEESVQQAHLMNTDENSSPTCNSRLIVLNNDKLAKTNMPPIRRTLPSKTITTTDGQKLIVVSTISPSHSNHSLTAAPSILQRTLTTIPFKNISMKNLDKFKIVSTSNTNPAPILAHSKQKMVTVRTTANKKIIPLSQVQVLNTKGGIKVLPLAGKLITKSNNHSSYYFTNTTSVDEESTKSTSSTSLVMSCKTQEDLPLPQLVLNKFATDDDMIIEENHAESTSASGTSGTSVATTADGDDPGECEEDDDDLNAFTEMHENGVIDDKMQLEENLETEIHEQIQYNEAEVTEIDDGQFDPPEMHAEHVNCLQDGVHQHNDIEMHVVHDDIHDEISDNGHHFDAIDDQQENNVQINEETIAVDIINEIQNVPVLEKNDHNVKDVCFDANAILEQLTGTSVQANAVGSLNHGKGHLDEDMPVDSEQLHMFDDKVDLDSSLFIYGNDHNEEVIVDGIEDQPIEVLNVVHAIDETSFPNIKNITS